MGLNCFVAGARRIREGARVSLLLPVEVVGGGGLWGVCGRLLRYLEPWVPG